MEKQDKLSEKRILLPTLSTRTQACLPPDKARVYIYIPGQQGKEPKAELLLSMYLLPQHGHSLQSSDPEHSLVPCICISFATQLLLRPIYTTAISSKTFRKVQSKVRLNRDQSHLTLAPDLWKVPVHPSTSEVATASQNNCPHYLRQHTTNEEAVSLSSCFWLWTPNASLG